MHIIKVNITRIMLRDRGSSSDIAIDGEFIIQPDDPTQAPLRQHHPENIRVDSLPPDIQAHVADLFAALQARLEKQYPVVQ